MDTAVAYHSTDAAFSVLNIPRWRAYLYQFASVHLWGNLPSPWQRKISKSYAAIYEKPYSRHWIRPYVNYYYKKENYLDAFMPPDGKKEFESFQDFFTRQFKNLPSNTSDWVWPAEGLLCDHGLSKNKKGSCVKGDYHTLDTVFGLPEKTLPAYYHFTNVFLHNKNYHRIHAPVSGTITRIQHIPGDLVILRPWIYKADPSLPAFRNERYNIDLTDTEGRTWYLSIIGGPAVGTIELAEEVVEGAAVNKLEELALFYLGSTCCMASPLPPRFHDVNTFVEVGAPY